MKLIIFDLDQTLVDFMSIHDKTTQILFKKHFNVDAKLTDLDFSGKSLNDNLHELARLKNIPEQTFDEKYHQLMADYTTEFNKSIPQNTTINVLPGVRTLLRELHKTKNILAMYTGSSPEIGNLVLRVTNLSRYFDLCFFGTEVDTRADMVRLAIEKAKNITGIDFEDKDIVIIGDSIRDIECGKLFNTVTIAVATGVHSKADLLKAGADYIFENMKNHGDILKAIEHEKLPSRLRTV